MTEARPMHSNLNSISIRPTLFPAVRPVMDSPTKQKRRGPAQLMMLLFCSKAQTAQVYDPRNSAPVLNGPSCQLKSTRCGPCGRLSICTRESSFLLNYQSPLRWAWDLCSLFLLKKKPVLRKSKLRIFRSDKFSTEEMSSFNSLFNRATIGTRWFFSKPFVIFYRDSLPSTLDCFLVKNCYNSVKISAIPYQRIQYSLSKAPIDLHFMIPIWESSVLIYLL